MAAYELKYTAEEIDGILESVDEKTIYDDATQSEHGLMSTTDKSKLDSLPSSQQINASLSRKVDKVEGKGLSENDYTDFEKASVASAYHKPQNGIPKTDLDASVKTSLDKAETAVQSEQDPTVPSWAKQSTKPSYNYSEIGNTPDLSGFITKSVSDLTNYYLKSETYTKAEVAALIGAIQQFHYEIYASPPQSGQGNVLYLIGPTGSGSDRYEEYVYANNAFTKIGDTSIDLSGYVTISALNTALAGYATTQDLEDSKVFWAEADVTTFSEIQDAIDAGRTVMLKDEDGYTYVLSYIDDTYASFSCSSAEENFIKTYYIYDDDSWDYFLKYGIESENNKVYSISSSSDNGTYPSARAVYQALQSYTPTSNLATVATSGSYNDLTNKPTIPTVPVQDVTVGGTSVVSNGTAVIPQEVFWVTYGTTTVAEIDAAIMAGKVVMCNYVNRQYRLVYYNSAATYIQLVSFTDNTKYHLFIKRSDDTWSNGLSTLELQSYRVSSLTGYETSTNRYPNTKATYDAIHPAYGSSQPQDGMLPNVLYKLGTLSGSVTIAFATPTDNTIENEYKFTFTADSTAPTITWPQSVTSWIGNSIDNGAPKVEADTYYEVSVLDGCGIFNKF